MRDLNDDLFEQEDNLIGSRPKQRIKRLAYSVDENTYENGRSTIFVILKCELVGITAISRRCFVPENYSLTGEELKKAIKKYFDGKIEYEEPVHEHPEDDS